MSNPNVLERSLVLVDEDLVDFRKCSKGLLLRNLAENSVLLVKAVNFFVTKCDKKVRSI